MGDSQDTSVTFKSHFPGQKSQDIRLESKVPSFSDILRVEGMGWLARCTEFWGCSP